MLSRLLSVTLVWTILLLPGPVMSGQLDPATRCRQCHIESIVEDLSKAFIHKPFVKELCQECHLANKSDNPLFSKTKLKNQKLRKTASHTNLLEQEFTSLIICSTCHPDTVGPESHPVNILPAKGMSIPPEYPTLADGRISCVTCHKHHASHIENRLVKARDLGFCVGCHRSKENDALAKKFQCRGKCNKKF